MKKLLLLVCIQFLYSQARTQSCAANAYSYPTGDPAIKMVTAVAVQDSSQSPPFPQITGYAWSNGETVASFPVSAPGTYCVTATFDNGCTATDCQTVTFASNPNNGPCYVDIFATTTIGQGYSLYASAGPDSVQVSYQWSNGASTSTISAPTQGTYCVTVTNANGCVADTCIDLTWNCSIYVFQNAQGNLSVNGWGQFPITYLWSNGETDNAVVNPTVGTVYCVTMTDAIGCTSETCIEAINQVNTTCSVYLWQSATNGEVYAGYGGVTEAEAVFSWSDPAFGDTSIVNPGFIWDSLCVTMTTIQGCVKSACIANTLQDKCIWSINRKRINSTTFALFPFGPFGTDATYQWSNGASTDTIYVTDAGTYALTVTGDCTASDSVAFVWTNNLQVGYFNIPLGSDPEEVRTWVIQHDPVAGTLTSILETPMNTNYTQTEINDLPNGTYLIKAAPTPVSPAYLTRMPTYYKSNLWWSEATELTFPSLVVSQAGTARRYISIDMIKGQNAGGPGFVGGLISDGANVIGQNVDDRSAGDPIYGASIILFDAAGNVVIGAYSDAAGGFSLPNLAYGTYKVVVDVPGFSQQVQWITISPSQSNHFLEMEMQSGSVSTAAPGQLPGFELWPNPVQDGKLWIKSPASGLARLKNIEGKNIADFDVQAGRQALNIGLLPTGVYLLDVQTATGCATQKVVVER
jgi:hypothetical protein